ncbi:MAG: DUF4258 domain-containing protein [candidate division WOR-3 bacterium]
MTKPLKPGDAIREARRLIEQGAVAFTPHVQTRMKEREFGLRDISRAFDVGRINRAPEWDAKRKKWKYTVDGTDVEGDSLSIVFAFDDGTLVIITGYRRDTV